MQRYRAPATIEFEESASPYAMCERDPMIQRASWTRPTASIRCDCRAIHKNRTTHLHCSDLEDLIHLILLSASGFYSSKLKARSRRCRRRSPAGRLLGRLLNIQGELCKALPHAACFFEISILATIMPAFCIVGVLATKHWNVEVSGVMIA